MGQIEERIAELGLTLPQASKPVAAYVPAVVTGNLVFTSGQIPMRSGSLPEKGKVGEGEGLVAPERAKEYAAICALNALAAVKSVIGDLDRVVRVVKVLGFVSSVPEFTGAPGVINGASELLKEIFGEKGEHARSAVAAPVLPLDSPVELEIIVEFA